MDSGNRVRKDRLKFAIWGIGKAGKTCVDALGVEKIDCIVDRKPPVGGYRRMPVLDVEAFLKVADRNIPVIVTPKAYAGEITEELEREGFTDIHYYTENFGKIIWFCLQFPKERLLADCYGASVYVYGKDVLAKLVLEYLSDHGVDVQLWSGNKNDAAGGIVFLTEEYVPDMDAGFRVISYRKYFLDARLYYRKELEKFRDMHLGERCFIIANGPSLRMVDLEILHKNNAVCFGVNYIFKAFTQTNWRPTYYMLEDTSGLRNIGSRVDAMAEYCKAIFINDICQARGIGDDKVKKYYWHIYYDRFDKEGEYPAFSNDFACGGFWGKTVIYEGCLQLAAYMGFSRIYLLGADCTFDEQADRTYHFYHENGNPDQVSRLQLDEMFRAYESARRYADAHGIRIYNATRGGNLEVFERVDFDSLFGE